MPEARIKKLERSQLYSEELGIDLSKKTDNELFKWFLASILYGNRILATIARHTYKAFEKYKLLAPQKIIDAGWDFLVNPVMREGGYVRYDESTSRTLLRICETLLKEHGGSLNQLHHEAKDGKDMEKRLAGFYGIGPVTVNIFLRELRPYWKKSNPDPLPIVRTLASKLSLPLKNYDQKSMAFVRLEAGLIRNKKDL